MLYLLLRICFLASVVNLIGRYTEFLSEIFVGAFYIGVSFLFGGFFGTVAIASVIVGKHSKSMITILFKQWVQVSQIFGVAVTIEDDVFSLRIFQIESGYMIFFTLIYSNCKKI